MDLDPRIPFPFKPYGIQEKFMKELYLTIENNKLGIFESPTGTGKSLSICCSALQWLRDNNKKILENLEKEIVQLKHATSNNKDSGDWLLEEYEKIRKNQTLATLQLKLDKVKKKTDYFKEMQNRVARNKSSTKNNSIELYLKTRNKKEQNEDMDLSEKENIAEDTEEDRDLVLDEIEDKDECDSEEEEANVEEENDNVKIYISSRTHSQLSQFVGEVKRTAFKDDTRLITLASRQHFCINSDVTRLKNVHLINERCLDMQKSKSKTALKGEDGKVLKRSKTKSCSGCPYYNRTNIIKLKERMLVEIMDMEDIVKCGKQLKACPYYASRMALDEAEVVLISHAGIVSSGARAGTSLALNNNVLILDEAHGLTAALENAHSAPVSERQLSSVVLISHAGIVSSGARAGTSLALNNNVLILDEAHGLTAALENAHSAPVSERQLSSVNTFLNFYIDKYRERLSCKNLLALNQISFVVKKLLAIIRLQNRDKISNEDTKIFTIEEFVIKAEIDHLNLRPLVEFCKNSRLAPKLHGFSTRYGQQAMEVKQKSTIAKASPLESFLKNIAKKQTDNQTAEGKSEQTQLVQAQTETSAGSGLYAILDFFEMLCDRSEYGRVLVQREHENGQLKYLLLNPAEHFSQVVKECRSLILAGGTMEPLAEFESLLTANIDCDKKEKLNIVRCDHVVPSQNVLAICLSKGPTNVNLNFSYENRMSDELITEVGRILRNICAIIPGGIVCFLPSYSYEQTVFDHLNKSKVIEGISKKKSIFREPKSAAEVDQVLAKYGSAVKNKDENRNGALLFSVVGGKLSEGLNFSDDMGRCVIVIGMPYPNIKSPEVLEKMNYLNRTLGSGAGNVYFENLCMKAVNQCIGRAVRHANDYACVILVDARYSRTQTISALPSFVQKSLMTNCSFGPTVAHIAKFFSRHKNKS